MARIAIVLAGDFEDSEFRVPYDHVRNAGHDVTIVGHEEGLVVAGKKGHENVVIEREASKVSAAEFDALIIPGGYSPDRLRTDAAVVLFVRQMAEQDKLIAAICHAGSLLIEAGIVRGKTVTSWPSIRTDLVNAGARWENVAVVEDGHLITSRQPDDLPPFCDAILARLGKAVRV